MIRFCHGDLGFIQLLNKLKCNTNFYGVSWKIVLFIVKTERWDIVISFIKDLSS